MISCNGAKVIRKTSRFARNDSEDFQGKQTVVRSIAISSFASLRLCERYSEFGGCGHWSRITHVRAMKSCQALFSRFTRIQRNPTRNGAKAMAASQRANARR